MPSKLTHSELQQSEYIESQSKHIQDGLERYGSTDIDLGYLDGDKYLGNLLKHGGCLDIIKNTNALLAAQGIQPLEWMNYVVGVDTISGQKSEAYIAGLKQLKTPQFLGRVLIEETYFQLPIEHGDDEHIGKQFERERGFPRQLRPHARIR